VLACRRHEGAAAPIKNSKLKRKKEKGKRKKAEKTETLLRPAYRGQAAAQEHTRVVQTGTSQRDVPTCFRLLDWSLNIGIIIEVSSLFKTIPPEPLLMMA
jgi:hypothetical protein